MFVVVVIVVVLLMSLVFLVFVIVIVIGIVIAFFAFCVVIVLTAITILPYSTSSDHYLSYLLLRHHTPLHLISPNLTIFTEIIGYRCDWISR